MPPAPECHRKIANSADHAPSACEGQKDHVHGYASICQDEGDASDLDGHALHDIARPPAQQPDLPDTLGVHQRRDFALDHGA